MTQEFHRVIVRSEAEADITAAAVWYQRQQAGLGDEFLAEVEIAITGAGKNPFLHPKLRRKPDVRRVPVRRFPYHIFFISRPDAVIIFRVLHSSRHEQEWKSNVPKD
jgi:plasmid stabilization system protein ParE